MDRSGALVARRVNDGASKASKLARRFAFFLSAGERTSLRANNSFRSVVLEREEKLSGSKSTTAAFGLCSVRGGKCAAVGSELEGAAKQTSALSSSGSKPN